MIRLTGIVKRYVMGEETLMALAGVDLHIGRNEYVALIRPSGSGKSTLMNLIGCLDTPTAGKYFCDGVDVSTLDKEELATLRRDKIGFVFQGFHLLTRMDATDNVAMPLGYARVPASERKVRARAALASVGLAERAGHRPNELSGGQQQRVAIARAIVSDPTLLICDEPTGDLDRASAEEILGLLQTLNREHGKTIVMVTHDPKAAEYATHTLHLDKGNLVESAAHA